ncbi:MAG: hypothetical protein KJ732_01235 [Candidatus Margulisbacteria bacterium]|nr:hypothetical protein [Candidatus Margulisiibacteriota bacterium]
MPLTGREKATIFLSILGAETSARVLRYLPDELADLIASGINHLPSPSQDALSEVLGEFKGFVALPESREAVPAPQIAQKPKSVIPKRQFGFLLYERPQMSAFLLSQLPGDQREEALNSLSREKGIVMGLLANLKNNILTEKLSAKLKEQFKGKLFSE